VLGLVATHDQVKNDATRSRRPDTATRNMARAIRPRCAAARGRRSGCRRSSRWPRSWSCHFLLPGRAVCPALGTGGRWTPWHATRPPGASGGANEVGHA
jgi:hypothetical protein